MAALGFKAPCSAYRVYSDPDLNAELLLFSGKAIDVPSLFIGGKSDWGTYAEPDRLLLLDPVTGAVDQLDATHPRRRLRPHKIDRARRRTLLLAFVNEVGGAGHTSG